MIYAFEGFELDTQRFELRAQGSTIPLERLVFDVLSYLVQNSDRLVPKEELQDKIWGDRFVSEAAVSTRVMAARKAIGDNGRDQRLIKTVHGRGFRFIGDVRGTSPEPATPPRDASQDGSTEQELATPIGTPAIHYSRTTDGVSIAHWSWGAGRPLVVMPDWIWSHIQSELRLPEVARWYGQLAERWRVIRYDGRGEGLSDRECDDFSLAARQRDLEAVAPASEPFAIFAHVSSSLTAMSFAAEQPDSVSHLVLWCGYSRAEEFGQTTQLRALTALVRNDWDMFVENIARSRVTGWTSETSTKALTRYFRDAATPEYAELAIASLDTVDVTDLLERVTTPTLVVHCTGVNIPSIDASRNLAARIPNAQLCILDGNAPIPHLGPTGPALRVIEDFLGAG